MDLEENEVISSDENSPSDSKSKSSENEKELNKLEEFEREKTNFIGEMKSKHQKVPLIKSPNKNLELGKSSFPF